MMNKRVESALKFDETAHLFAKWRAFASSSKSKRIRDAHLDGKALGGWMNRVARNGFNGWRDHVIAVTSLRQDILDRFGGALPRRMLQKIVAEWTGLIYTHRAGRELKLIKMLKWQAGRVLRSWRNHARQRARDYAVAVEIAARHEAATARASLRIWLVEFKADRKLGLLWSERMHQVRHAGTGRELAPMHLRICAFAHLLN